MWLTLWTTIVLCALPEGISKEFEPPVRLMAAGKVIDTEVGHLHVDRAEGDVVGFESAAADSRELKPAPSSLTMSRQRSHHRSA